jgi:hypothetical protein
MMMMMMMMMAERRAELIPRRAPTDDPSLPSFFLLVSQLACLCVPFSRCLPSFL